MLSYDPERILHEAGREAKRLRGMGTFGEPGSNLRSKPAQRAIACSPGRVRKPWVRRRNHVTSPRSWRQHVVRGESVKPWVYSSKRRKPAQRAAACSPGRVREALGIQLEATQARAAG